MAASRVNISGVSVAHALFSFVRDEALPGTALDEQAFWEGAAAIMRDLSPRIRAALARREELQSAIDSFHSERPGVPDDLERYERFLRSVGYLVDEPADFQIATEGVDREISTVCGPQLVVPLLNARFAANAANARWGSLYDALYGTDAIDESQGRERAGAYNPVRGAAVIDWVRGFLDRHTPLDGASHRDVTGYSITGAALAAQIGSASVRLAEPGQLVGYRGEPERPTAVVLVHHGLHVELQVDRSHPVGAGDSAGISDVLIESALTSIMDLEDSVSAVDADDKVVGYRNWLHLMQGRLEAKVDKGDESFIRTLNDDRAYTRPSGEGTVTLPGRALMLVRHVGHLPTSDAVLDAAGNPVPEGILDALMTGLGSVHDLRGSGSRRNSGAGSMYVVKPKNHGPDEVALSCEILARTEQVLGLPPLSIKIGIMDEERRTSVNLKACIHEARDRVVFVNTGFLDRTGDEIHTSMAAGPMTSKAGMKDEPWMAAYEDTNVDVGLECGFPGRAQIGKGMWAAPDSMAEMLEQKVAHPRAGASCAWVPSPTAATLHATHYHLVDVAARQRELGGQRRSTLGQLLTLPLADPTGWDHETRRLELDNNVQSTLGYVVRWVNAGVGCSKVPDLSGTALMEDRATCRISSQHVANWTRHGVISLQDVEDSLRRMALVVDRQNADDPDYEPMAPRYDGHAYTAARELLIHGGRQPSGYTELILHRHRRTKKQSEGRAER